MFSGIIQSLGIIKTIRGHDVQTFMIEIEGAQHCRIGDSVSVNGVCLTVTEIFDASVSFDVVPETLRKTNLAKAKVGDQVNIELALKYGDFVGGHMVQGHVDEVGKICSLEDEGEAWLLEIQASPQFIPYLIPKGFVTLDGMSITVIDVRPSSFTVTLIPHTIAHTRAQYYQVGSEINLEADATGKYIFNYLKGLQNVSTN